MGVDGAATSLPVSAETAGTAQPRVAGSQEAHNYAGGGGLAGAAGAGGDKGRRSETEAEVRDGGARGGHEAVFAVVSGEQDAALAAPPPDSTVFNSGVDSGGWVKQEDMSEGSKVWNSTVAVGGGGGGGGGGGASESFSIRHLVASQMTAPSKRESGKETEVRGEGGEGGATVSAAFSTAHASAKPSNTHDEEEEEDMDMGDLEDDDMDMGDGEDDEDGLGHRLGRLPLPGALPGTAIMNSHLGNHMAAAAAAANAANIASLSNMLIAAGATPAQVPGMMAAAAAAAAPRAVKRRPLRCAAEITQEELSSCFHLPSEAACRKLGIGLTVLKRQCRKFGIKRWPFRKMKSLDRLITNVQAGISPGDQNRMLVKSVEELEEQKRRMEGCQVLHLESPEPWILGLKP